MTRATSSIAIFALALPLLAADSLTERGMLAFRQGRYSEAGRLLAEAVRNDPRDEHARTFLALTHAATGRCSEAVTGLAEQFGKPGNADLSRLAGLGLVQCYLAAGETAKAVPIAGQLEAQYPADADVLYQAARVHMRAFNDTTRRMFDKTPSSYRVNQLSGEIFETQNKFAEAAAEYRKAIAKNPQALNLHFRLGRALLLESHSPEALALAQKEFEAELALNPSDAAAEFQIGQILDAGGGRDQALVHFQKALELNPSFPEAALAVGRIRVQAKQYDEAIPLLRKVVELQPRNEAAHYNLMMAYRNSGKMDQARREQEELQKLQRPPEGEFTDFLKRLGEKAPQQ